MRKIVNMEDIVKSFEETCKSEYAYDLVATVGDTAIDTIIDSGVLDSVPVLGVIKGLYKVTKNYQTYRLMKKIHRLIFVTQDSTPEERITFLSEYTKINKENGCEVLLALLDRLDNTNKVDILTNLMRAKIKGEINMENFIRLCTVLERIPFSDINQLSKYKDDYYEDGSTDILLSAGVLFNTVIDSNGTNKYRLNSLGVMLLKYGLQQNIDFEINTSTHLSDLDWHEA